MDEIIVSISFVEGGFVNLLIANGERQWAGYLAKDANLDAPLPCMWEGDEKITLVLLPEDVKTAILAKWAELEA